MSHSGAGFYYEGEGRSRNSDSPPQGPAVTLDANRVEAASKAYNRALIRHLERCWPEPHLNSGYGYYGRPALFGCAMTDSYDTTRFTFPRMKGPEAFDMVTINTVSWPDGFAGNLGAVMTLWAETHPKGDEPSIPIETTYPGEKPKPLLYSPQDIAEHVVRQTEIGLQQTKLYYAQATEQGDPSGRVVLEDLFSQSLKQELAQVAAA